MNNGCFPKDSYAVSHDRAFATVLGSQPQLRFQDADPKCGLHRTTLSIISVMDLLTSRMTQHVTPNQRLAVYSITHVHDVPFPDSNIDPYQRGVPEQYSKLTALIFVHLFSSRREAKSSECK